MSSMSTLDNMDRYKRLEKLGEGTYGLVYKAKDLESNQYVAIKKIKLDNNEEGIPATTMREVSLLSHLKHPNIIQFDNCLYVHGELYLIFEFMSCDLKGYLDDLSPNQHISRHLLKKFTYFLTEGIRFCHSRRILHRDLKPQNILIGDDDELKIADFGLGREHGLPIGTLTHEVVTLWYRPPEILLGKKKYSGACDIWGIGCIFAEMATKIPLFPGDSEIDQLFQIYRILGTPNPTTWPGIEELPEWKPIGPRWKRKDLYKELNEKLDVDGIDLLEQMLRYAPSKRITAKQILAHKWFDEIREEMIGLFGNKYPHCGSKQYQLEKWQRMQQSNKENQEIMNESDDGQKHQRKRRRITRNRGNQQEKDDNNKMNEDNDTDYECSNDRKDGGGGFDQDYSDDDDLTANAEEWNNHNNINNKRRNNNNDNNNLSQPMDEDEEEYDR